VLVWPLKKKLVGPPRATDSQESSPKRGCPFVAAVWQLLNKYIFKFRPGPPKIGRKCPELAAPDPARTTQRSNHELKIINANQTASTLWLRHGQCPNSTLRNFATSQTPWIRSLQSGVNRNRPQKHRLSNRARRVGIKAGNQRKTTKNPENRQKLRDPAPA
jgi:hypothetical protein